VLESSATHHLAAARPAPIVHLWALDQHWDIQRFASDSSRRLRVALHSLPVATLQHVGLAEPRRPTVARYLLVGAALVMLLRVPAARAPRLVSSADRGQAIAEPKLGGAGEEHPEWATGV